MAQRQNLRRRRITYWGCGGAGHLRRSCPRINKEDRNIKCCWCGRTGHNSKSSLKKSPDGKTSPLSILQRSVTGLFGTLHLRNGVLYRKWESDDGKTFRWQLILPKSRDSAVLKELHGSPTGGNFGVMMTLQKVHERFYWNNVNSDVEKCSRICDPCASRKGPRKCTRGRLQLYNGGGVPFERIASDILGPFQRSSDGNNNILVVMDYFGSSVRPITR
ncbi:retrovirus-related Pol polyprotein from transposon 412 [Trichonephila clavipes]|nr:retrovirus-related Pol polyprotein from transposon 412 [Trichonephila clavipes]